VAQHAAMLFCSPARLTAPPVLPVTDIFRVHLRSRSPWLCSNKQDSWLFLHVLLKQGIGWVTQHGAATQQTALLCGFFSAGLQVIAWTVTTTQSDRVSAWAMQHNCTCHSATWRPWVRGGPYPRLARLVCTCTAHSIQRQTRQLLRSYQQQHNCTYLNAHQ